MSRRAEFQRIMDDLKIDQKTFDDEDYRLMEKGGYSLTDSEADQIDTESLKDSLSKSIASIDIGDTKIDMKKVLLSRQRAQQTQPEDKNKYSSIIMMLEKQISLLQNENAKLKVEHDREIGRLAAENQRTMHKLKDETFRNTSMSKIQSSRDFLNVLSDVVNGMIPEVEYARVRDVPERSLKQEESILIHVWELVDPLKRENKQLRIEIQNLREEVRTTNEKHQKILQELKHSNELLERKDDDVKRNIDNYESSIKLLEQQLNRATLDVETLREKGLKYDELYRDFVKLEKEKIILENKVSFFAGTPVDTRNDVPMNENDLRVKYSILCTDKEYLTRENLRQTEVIKKLEDKIEKQEFEITEHKKIAKDYMQSVLSTKSSMFNSYEKQINDELYQLKDKHREEVEAAKNTLREIYDRQLTFLKDGKEALELKNEQLEATAKERQKAYDEILMENRNLQRKVYQDMGEMKIQLNLRTEELARTQNLYEETLANLKSLRTENDMLKDKVNILKSEYYKLEGTLKEESAGVRAQLAVAKEQLANYEAIEREIDEAVVGLASRESGDGDNIFIQTLHSAPTASKRRIQQALALAQKLNIKQNEVAELGKELREAKSRVESLEDELRLAKSLLEKSNQPYQYLVKNIEEKEKESLEYKNKVRQIDENYQNLRQEHARLIEDYATLQKDMNKLMIKRENIRNIQRILLDLLQDNRENITQNDIHQLIDEINMITDTKGTQYGSFNYDETTKNKSFYREQPKFRESNYETARGQQTKSPTKSTATAPQWYQKLKQMKGK